MAKQSQGPRGRQGIPGPPGPKGSTGSAGHQGPIGKSGPTGATGQSGARGLTGAKGATRAAGGKARRQLLISVERHIENIYGELSVQMQRMAKLQQQVDELRGKLRQVL
jgi:hypothetical protein